jgi:bacterioferritin-associated ferredoxin
MKVDRCVCFDVSFRRLKAHADEHGCGLAQLQATFGCGRACAFCLPYLRRMLQTGETSFDPLPCEQTPGPDRPAGA